MKIYTLPTFRLSKLLKPDSLPLFSAELADSMAITSHPVFDKGNN